MLTLFPSQSSKILKILLILTMFRKLQMWKNTLPLVLNPPFPQLIFQRSWHEMSLDPCVRVPCVFFVLLLNTTSDHPRQESKGYH